MHFVVLLSIFSLFAFQCARAAAVDPLVEVQAADQDQSDRYCNFSVGDFKYDLCPLLRPINEPFRIVMEQDTPPTVTKRTYDISLKEALKIDKKLPAESQCPDGTRICLIVSYTRPDHPSTPEQVLQVIPIAMTKGLKPTANMGNKTRTSDHHSPLLLNLHGGIYTQRQQKATFIFRCNPDVVEPSKPTFAWTWNGTYTFNWETQHACHKFVDPSPEDDKTPAEPPDTPPADPEGDDSTPQPDFEEPVKAYSPVLTLIWCAVLLFVFLRTLSYFGIFSFRRIMGFFSGAGTSSLGGPSASRLLRWAQQAGFFKEEEGEDGMSDSEYSPISGEEIPLTPSPRNGTFGQGIGTTTYGTGKGWGER